MRIRTITLLLAVLLAVPGGAAVANDDNGNGNDEDGATHLTLYTIESEFVYLPATGAPAEDAPPEPGDRFVSVDLVYEDEALTELVGRNDITCTFTEAATGETEEDPFELHSLCHGVVTLDGQGTLAWQASITITEQHDPGTPVATVAITGGTGDFMAAGGYVEVFDTTTSPEEITARYEVTLLDLARR